jgi:hypothetical protein
MDNVEKVCHFNKDFLSDVSDLKYIANYVLFVLVDLSKHVTIYQRVSAVGLFCSLW